VDNDFAALGLNFSGILSLRDRTTNTYFKVRDNTTDIYTELLPTFREQYNTHLKKVAAQGRHNIQQLCIGSNTPLLLGRYDLPVAGEGYFLLRLLNGNWLKRRIDDRGFYFASSGVQDASVFTLIPTAENIAKDDLGHRVIYEETPEPMLVSVDYVGSSYEETPRYHHIRVFPRMIASRPVQSELRTYEENIDNIDTNRQFISIPYFKHREDHPKIENQLLVGQEYQNSIWRVLFPQHDVQTILEELSINEHEALEKFIAHIKSHSNGHVKATAADLINPLHLENQHIRKALIDLGSNDVNENIANRLHYIVAQRKFVEEYFAHIIDSVMVNFSKYHTIVDEIAAQLSLSGDETRIEAGDFPSDVFTDVLSVAVAATVPIASVNTALSVISVAFNLFFTNEPNKVEVTNNHDANNQFKLKYGSLLNKIRNNFDDIRYQIEDCRTLMCSSLRILESWDRLEVRFPDSTRLLAEQTERKFTQHTWKSLLSYACRIKQGSLVKEEKVAVPLGGINRNLARLCASNAFSLLEKHKQSDLSVVAVSWQIRVMFDDKLSQYNANFEAVQIEYHVWHIQLHDTKLDNSTLEEIRVQQGFTDQLLGKQMDIPFFDSKGKKISKIKGSNTLYLY